MGCMGVVSLHHKWCVVMERLRCSLHDELQARSPEALLGGDALPQQLRWATQAAMAVQLLHSAGMVHRDLKSSNFLLGHDGRLVVADFGSLKLPDSSTSTVHSFGTTLGWCAPEFLGCDEGDEEDEEEEEADACTHLPAFDVYALGVVLWEIATGVVPFGWVSANRLPQVILRIRPDTPHPLLKRHACNHMPREYVVVLERCLSADPADRPTMDWVLEALSGLCEVEEGRLQERLRKPDLPSEEQERARSGSRKLSEILLLLRRMRVEQGAGAVGGLR